MVARIQPKNPDLARVYLFEWRTRPDAPDKKKTLEEVAELIGTTRGTVQRMETNVREPNVGYLAAFAEALGIGVADLFHHPGSPTAAELRAQRAERRLREARELINTHLSETESQ